VEHQRLMLLVDTNVWLKFYWRLPLPGNLEETLKQDALALSPISVLEAATLVRKGRMPGVRPLAEWLASALDGYIIAAVTPEIAAAAGADPWAHQDPADRLIIHTAKTLGYTLVHTDATIRKRRDFPQKYFRLPGPQPPKA
jgi:PIN domain nuclease of toxin-antitoxin system